MYKSARGKTIDMDKVKLSNETTTAVGNMRVNARGDLLGAGGQVVAGRNQIMDQVYAVPEPMYSPNDPQVRAEQQATLEASKAKELHDLANNLSMPSSPEPIITEEPTDAPKPAGRGSLANSIGKPVSIKQQPISDPRTPKGPSRI
jgi:hypothetical protein